MLFFGLCFLTYFIKLSGKNGLKCFLLLQLSLHRPLPSTICYRWYFFVSLNIIKVNNFMIEYCVSWWRYVSRFFSSQEVILLSTFALNFISYSKFPLLVFLWKTIPWWQRSFIFRSIVKNICLFLAFSQIIVSSYLSLT